MSHVFPVTLMEPSARDLLSEWGGRLCWDSHVTLFLIFRLVETSSGSRFTVHLRFLSRRHRAARSNAAVASEWLLKEIKLAPHNFAFGFANSTCADGQMVF